MQSSQVLATSFPKYLDCSATMLMLFHAERPTHLQLLDQVETALLQLLALPKKQFFLMVLNLLGCISILLPTHSLIKTTVP
jgi:hypothetical protein